MSGPCRSSASAEARGRNAPGTVRACRSRQPVERLWMIPDFGLGFGQQLRRVVLPPLRRPFLDGRLPCRPHLRFQRSGTAAGAHRHVRDAQFGTGFTEAHTLYIHHVPDLSPVLPQRRHENTPGMWFSVQVWPRSLSRSGQIMKRSDLPTSPPQIGHGPFQPFPRAFTPAPKRCRYSSNMVLIAICPYLSVVLFCYLLILFIFLSEWTDGQICM